MHIPLPYYVTMSYRNKTQCDALHNCSICFIQTFKVANQIGWKYTAYTIDIMHMWINDEKLIDARKERAFALRLVEFTLSRIKFIPAVVGFELVACEISTHVYYIYYILNVNFRNSRKLAHERWGYWVCICYAEGARKSAHPVRPVPSSVVD